MLLFSSDCDSMASFALGLLEVLECWALHIVYSVRGAKLVEENWHVM